MPPNTVILAACLGAGILNPATAHQPAMVDYSEWRKPNGVSCCGDHDCHPTTMCIQPDGTEGIQGQTECHPIPWHSLQAAPDGGVHICELNGNVLCAAIGAGT